MATFDNRETYYAVDVVQDLEAERALVAKLRAERDRHRSNEHELRQLNDRLEAENSGLRADLQAALQDQRALRLEHERRVAEWEAKLDAKYRELAAHRPDQLEQARAMQDLQDAFQSRTKNLEETSEKYRQANLELRQELESLRQQLQKANRSAVHSDLNAMHSADADALRSEVTFLQQRIGDGVPDNELRRARQANSALKLKHSSLLAELEAVRAEKETCLMQHEQAKRLLTRTSNEAQANARSLNAERESFRLKSQRLQEELAGLRREMTDLENKLHESQQKNVTLKGEITDLKHKQHKQLREAQAQVLAAKDAGERYADDLKTQLADAKARISVLEISLKDATATINHKDKDAQSRVHQAREEEWMKQRGMQQEKAALENKISLLEREVSELRNRTDTEEMRVLRTELQQRIETLSLKNQSLKDKLAATEKHRDGLDGKVQRLSKVQEEHRKLQEAHRGLTRAHDKTKAAHDKLEALLETRSQELVNLQLDLDRQTEIHERDLDETQKARFRETQVFQDQEMRMAENVEALAQKLQEALDAARQHKERCVQKQAELNATIQSLEQHLRDETAKSAKTEASLQHCRKCCECMKKKLEHFKFVLTNEGYRQSAGVMHAPSTIPMPFSEAFAERGPVNTHTVKERFDAWAEGEEPERTDAKAERPQQ